MFIKNFFLFAKNCIKNLLLEISKADSNNDIIFNDSISGISSINKMIHNSLITSRWAATARKPVILIASENEIINGSNKKIIEEILTEKRSDYDIVLLNDGLDIIRFALNLQKNYNIIKYIFTDEKMEYFSGTEAIQFLRKLEFVKNFKRAKIFCLTCEENKVTDYIIQSGADHVLIKPISQQLVKSFIS